MNLFHVKNDFLIYHNNAIKLDGLRAQAFFFLRGNLLIGLGSVFGPINDYTQAILDL